MSDFRPVTVDFAVAPQLAPEDMAAAATHGYRLVINNRPDDEAPGQPSGAEMAAAAQAAGMHYAHIPVRGGPTPAQVEAMYTAVAGAGGPVLAFCRSGTRSITTWALGQAAHGDRTPQELIEIGGEAGYDLSGALA